MTPLYSIFADGVDVTASFQGRLLDLSVKDEAGQESDTLSITLDDRDGALALPRAGARLAVALGYRERGLYPMGVFVVDDVTSKGGNSGMTLAITARAVDTRETLKERRDKHYDKKTLGDILQEEAGEHGLAAVVSPQLADFQYDYLAKRGESLLHFGGRLARRHDATFKIAGGKLIFARRGAGESASGFGLPGVAVTRPGNLIGWSIKPKMGRPRYGEARAAWYDRHRAKRVIETVAGGKGPASVNTHLQQNSSEAKTAAQTDRAQKERQKAGGSLTIIGNPLVMAGTIVTVSGCRTGVDGAWLAKSVEHNYSENGYVTKITVENPGGQK